MTGNKEGDAVQGQGTANRPGSPCVPDIPGKFAVGTGLPERDIHACCPNPQFKIRAENTKGNIKIRIITRKIGIQLDRKVRKRSITEIGT